MVEDEHWLRKNWTTPVILLGIFLVALYLRAYFPWDLAVQDRLLSGGSDAFYYERIINHCAETGTQLVFDPRLNFPMGLTNPRPPLFSWTTCATAKALTPLFGSQWEALTVVFLGSTALWGALTIIPTYFLTKEAFGRRSAFLAAFFLAIMPAHLQRSTATNGDHDAMVLFFVVTAFYFFLRSLKSLKERRWVEDYSFWTKGGRTAIRKGIGAALRENRTSVLYAVLSGWCTFVVALTWQGWAYAPIILLVYFLLQVLVHRFRNQDTMGVLLMFVIALGLPLLASFPWYFQMRQIGVWYDVPLYLYLAAVGLGIVFTATRDYPWALVLPAVVGVGGASLLVLSFFYPAISAAFVSGAGYFVRTKAYETIAEAQPPGISQVILSFGVATYFMSLFGLFWMARNFPKRPTADFLFVIVWAIAAIFMANAAARFIFNASPAFAMTSAWVTVLLIEWLRFDDMRKTFRSLGGKRLTALRRSVKVRHVFASLLILFILLLPNVWSGVDAAIPFERKSEYDRQVYNAYPSFLKPEGYDAQVQGGGSFFFGAFGYSLPLEKEYYPSAWAWLRQQDADVHPVENRPAFLSWWDYGFEAVDVGAHPTVADNFLDGYHLAGNFITSQSEEEAIALLDLRLLEGNFWANQRRFGAEARRVLEDMSVPWQKIEDAFRTPSAYTSLVENDPLTYGLYQGVQPQNAQYIYGRRVLMDALDADQLATLNHALRSLTGASIRYFAVDTRLFPIDGQNTGIFYAPAKLSDHRIAELRDGRSLPIDFFDVMATTTTRGVIDLREVTADDQVTSLSLRYKSMFYNSTFYRAYVGFPPSVAGQTCNDCIPGVPSPTNQQIAQIQPMQAWNLSHFKLVYKTAYYNPFPAAEVQNHTDAWRAMEWMEARDLQGEINRGNATGVVDLSGASTIRRGIVIVKYYDGAFLNGTVRLGGLPWPGVRVTVHDEFDIPHDSVVTGEDGRFSVLLPFGDIHVQATLGTPDGRSLAGPTTVSEFRIQVSDAASMREEVDSNGDGLVDWKMERDIEVAGETLDGIAFVDVDHDGARDEGEPILDGADVTLSGGGSAPRRTGRVAAHGHVFIEGLYPGAYSATIHWRGRTLTVTNITIASGQGPRDLVVIPATLEGFILDETGRRLGGATIVVRDALNGTALRATGAANGSYAVPSLLPGTFDVEASGGDRRSLPTREAIVTGTETHRLNVTVYPSATVTLQTAVGGAPTGFVTVSLQQRSAARHALVVTSDSTGNAVVSLPAGTWDVHARHYQSNRLFAFVGSLTVRTGDTLAFVASLDPGAIVSGRLFERGNSSTPLGGAEILIRGPAGELRLPTDLQGAFLTHLPLGTFTIQVTYLDFTFNEARTFTGDTTLDLGIPRGVRIDGSTIRAFPANETVQIEDAVRDAIVIFTDGVREYRALTEIDGRFTVGLPGDTLFGARVEHPGFVTLTRSPLTPFVWQTGARFELVAREIPVSGALLLDGAPFGDGTLPVVFRALSPGAVTRTATPEGSGAYTVSLSPGRYAVEVDRDLSGTGVRRLQLRSPTNLTVNVGDRPIPLDLDLIVRVRVDGTVVTQSGQPRSTIVRFDGPDPRSASATDGQFATLLAPGRYTVSTNLTVGSEVFLALRSLDVSDPVTITLSLVLATNVTGTVRHSGNPIGGIPVTLTRSGGETVTATSDAFGRYYEFALAGLHEVRVDHVASATDDGVTRQVRYAFADTLTVGQSPFQAFDIALDRTLENTTVSGTVRFQNSPVAAQLTFLARGTGGLNATATAAPGTGAYTVGLQPGRYDMYVFAPFERGAFLGPLEVTSTPVPFDLTLSPGIEARGVTLRGVARVTANLTLSGGEGRVTTRTDATGTWVVFLPADTYSVEAIAAGTERGVTVTYRATASLLLTEPTILNLQLAKTVQRGVDITWDPLQRTGVSPGGTVVYQVIVKNTGNEDDTIVVSGSSPDFSFSFRDPETSVPFGATGNERVVTITITANAGARVDHPAMTVTARSNVDSTAVKSVTLELDVSRFRGLRASVTSVAPTWDGRFLNYTIEVTNAGNGGDTFRAELSNTDDLLAAGWRAALLGTDGQPAGSLTLTIAANTTERRTLRLENAGGRAGALAQVRVENTLDATYQTLVAVSLQLPALAVEGSIRVGGTGIGLREPGIDLATGAFLVSLVSLIAAVVYLSILRRRSR